ncbi:MAG: ribosome maturation factor RimM [Anaeromicrobium sp.]|jgi:16S rRNA processing protein RimM|uniref:ribosome maturation factor RimM n=1 Tax=Anaeromicrobium sp. TaxID=1929132 RepID=UPI0025D1BCE7|nr:ribosome maturation factor RimM [Anaeromicrobium sp.]MCT4594865.1 ribosome maturation factor RimM [Anaeromicrobium sp.]
MSNLLKVGQIVGTHGIRGEVRVYPLTDYKERFEELKWVYMDGESDEKYHIKGVKYKKNMVILNIKEINTCNDAETYRDKYLYIDRENARELPEDTYFIRDLIGIEVFTTENEYIGKIENVIQTSANDIYEIKIEGKKSPALIPAVGEFVKEVNISEKKMIIKLIEGLIE